MNRIAIVLVLAAVLVMTGVALAVNAPPVAAGGTPGGPLAPAEGLTTASAVYTKAVYSWTRSWTATIGAQGSDVVMDSSGNLYVAGEFRGTVNFDPAGPNLAATITSQKNTYDAFLSKFDSSGAFQWVRTWGGAPAYTPTASYDGRDAANGVAVDAAGNVYVAGLFQNTVDFGAGQVITSNAPTGNNNIFACKFSGDGAIQWARAWGGKIGGEAYSIAVDKVRGFVYVEGDWSTVPNTGTVDFNPAGSHDWHANHGFFDAFLAKYDLDGGFVWAKTWGGEGYDDGPGVAVDSAGNVYVGGMYASRDPSLNFDPDGGSAGLGHPASDSGSIVDVFLSKFNAAGQFQWVQTWGAAGTDEAGGRVMVDSADNIYLSGRFGCTHCNFNPGGTPAYFSSNGDLDALIAKYDGNGQLKWARTWGGSGWDALGGMALDGADNIYTTGLFVNTVDFNPWGSPGDVHTAQGGRDIFMNKFDSGGRLQWTKIWGGPGEDLSLGLAVDATGTAFATGGFFGTVDFNPWGAPDNQGIPAQESAFLTRFAAVGVPLNVSSYLPLVGR